jgi:acyl carrier protein phosphodiesterase
MDILYDHFLAADETIFPGSSLLEFTNNVYNTLEKETVHLPPRFLTVLTYMKMETGCTIIAQKKAYKKVYGG